MIIKDPKGFYELKVDKARRIVYETTKGSMSSSDFERMTDEYVNKIIPFLGTKDWAKFCDIRENKPNTDNSPEHVNKQIARLISNGFSAAAVLIKSVTLKLQVKRAVKTDLETKYFDDKTEADEWLKSKGF